MLFRSGACQELRTFRIDQDLCKGCTLCKQKCPADAIVGEPKKAHYILEDVCIGCGTCVDVCRSGAIYLVRKGEESKSVRA